MVTVIDGPAGSGKSSTARAVADKLQIEYIDSGALYRTATLLYIEAGKDREAFFTLLDQKEISFQYADRQFQVRIDGRPVTEQIRTPRVAASVSEVAAMPRVRAYVNDLMRETVKEGIYIAEGRDLGTAVFPDAEIKFFMSADIGERAQRRFEERKSQNPDLTLDEVRKNIEQRDFRDASRQEDPLKKADDAVEIDTTHLDFEQQVDQICLHIRNAIQNEAS